ncbi:MAG: glycosyltransferase family 4 protein [Parvularculaceae bacterium]
MSYPPAFEKEFSKGSQAVVRIGRMFSGVGNMLFPGKKRAARVLVANERTQNSLPVGVPAERVRLLVENGVDLTLWGGGDNNGEKDHKPNFVFVGRLVWWKAVELLIDAFAAVDADATLTIIGDGPERARLEKHAIATPAFDRIFFEGFRPQSEIRNTLSRARALVLPSLRECGGAVVLEAFACGAPAIATRWGGPEDYITDDTGVLVAPDSRDGFIGALTAAMNELAKNPGKAHAMGEAARRRVEDNFTWSAKARQMTAIYEDVLAEAE